MSHYKKCSHCGSEDLKCLKTGFSFSFSTDEILGIHGDLFGCKDCCKLTIFGVPSLTPWDTEIDASLTSNFFVEEHNGYNTFCISGFTQLNHEFIEFMKTYNHEWMGFINDNN